MLYFWKTKDLIFFYKFKLSLRNFKYFVNQTYKLIKIGTSFNLVYKFIINYFKIDKKNTDFINRIYKISNFSFPDWFSNKIPILIRIFNKHKFPDRIDILEIGSFEGRSSLFFINYFKDQLLIDNINVTCVDTWEGSKETFHENINFNLVENNFDNNLIKFSSIIDKNKTTSENFFLKKNNKSYDLILIDGSHEFKDVLSDAENSIKVINKNGIIIFDDFNWFHYKDEKLNPAHAINTFLKDNFDQFEILFVGMILILKKI